MALSMANAGLLGPIPDSLGRLGNLSVLSLQGNQLSGAIPEGLGKLEHMYHMDLSRNRLSGEIPFTPAFVQKLGGNLDLSNNTGLCASASSASSGSASAASDSGNGNGNGNEEEEARKLGLAVCPRSAMPHSSSSASVFRRASLVCVFVTCHCLFLHLNRRDLT